MYSLLISFILSLLLTVGLIYLSKTIPNFFVDHDLLGIQKFHKIPVPRVGGLAIFLSVTSACIFTIFTDQSSATIGIQLIICSTPVFLLGLLEDFTNHVKPALRLISSLVSGYLFVLWMSASVSYTDISILDALLQLPFLSMLFTCAVLAGLTNAYNIIDGFNGLTSMTATITLAAISYVGFLNQDMSISLLALIFIAAIAGFFLFNYPRGLIFLGDSGAYFLGFWIGCLSVLLAIRNPNVSPWFAALINIYPIFETLFSIWRKKFIRKMSPSTPDGAHLHMLIYGRISKWLYTQTNGHFIQNCRTSPFLWMLSLVAVIPACIWWNNSFILQLSVLIFCITYCWIYLNIVRFKIQRLLKHLL